MLRLSLPPIVSRVSALRLNMSRVRFSVRLLCLLTVASPSRTVAHAQSGKLTVNYGTGNVGAFRRRLATLMDSSSDISNKVAAIAVAARYCDPETQKEDGARLKAARAEFDALAASYNAFKGTINSTIARANLLAEFTAAGYSPGAPNFWTTFDQEIITHTRNDLVAAEKIFAASRVVDCTEKKTAAAPPPRAPPTAPPRTPLARFTRPIVPPMPPAPVLPGAFCTEAERAAYVKTVIQPMMDANKAVTDRLSEYTNRMWDEIGKQGRVGDTVATKALNDEMRWGNTEHLRWDKRWFELQRMRDHLTVIDCNNRRVGGIDSFPPIDTVKSPQFGYSPKAKLKFDVAYEYSVFHQFVPTLYKETTIDKVIADNRTSGIGFGVSVEKPKWSCGLSAHFNSLKYDESLKSTKPNYPIRSTGMLRGQFYDGSCGPSLHHGPWVTHFYFGGTLAVDRLEILDYFVDGPTIPESRSLNTFKTNFGGAVDYSISDMLDLRIAATHTVGKWTGDADANTRLGIGLKYRPHLVLPF